MRLAILLASALITSAAAARAETVPPVTSAFAQPASSGSILLRWRAPNDGASAAIYRRVGTGAYRLVSTIPSGIQTYVDTGLSAPARYDYLLYRHKPGMSPSAQVRLSQSPYSPPIVITRGGVYRGNWESLDPAMHAVTIRTREPVMIERSFIRSKAKAIDAMDVSADLIVRDTVANAMDPRVAGQTKGCFIDIGNFRGVSMDHNRIDGFSCGIRALNWDADIQTRSNQRVYVRNNQIRNVDGRPSDGRGGWQIILHPPLGTGIALNSVQRADVRIEWNEIISKPWASRSEDVITTYASGGIASRPILIRNNFVRGAYHGDPTAQVDYSGAVINLGDCPSGDIHCAYVHATENVVVSFSNAGMGIAGGRFMRVWNNRAVSAQRLPNGQIIGSNWRVGYGFWNYYNSPNFTGNALFNNYAWVASRDGTIAGNYFPSGTPQSVYGNVIDGVPGQPPARPLTTAAEDREYRAWLARAAAARQTIGPRQ